MVRRKGLILISILVIIVGILTVFFFFKKDFSFTDEQLNVSATRL